MQHCVLQHCKRQNQILLHKADSFQGSQTEENTHYNAQWKEGKPTELFFFSISQFPTTLLVSKLIYLWTASHKQSRERNTTLRNAACKIFPQWNIQNVSNLVWREFLEGIWSNLCTKEGQLQSQMLMCSSLELSKQFLLQLMPFSPSIR